MIVSRLEPDLYALNTAAHNPLTQSRKDAKKSKALNRDEGDTGDKCKKAFGGKTLKSSGFRPLSFSSPSSL